MENHQYESKVDSDQNKNQIINEIRVNLGKYWSLVNDCLKFPSAGKIEKVRDKSGIYYNYTLDKKEDLVFFQLRIDHTNVIEADKPERQIFKSQINLDIAKKILTPFEDLFLKSNIFHNDDDERYLKVTSKNISITIDDHFFELIWDYLTSRTEDFVTTELLYFLKSLRRLHAVRSIENFQNEVELFLALVQDPDSKIEYLFSNNNTKN
jgi:hypothetical protein